LRLSEFLVSFLNPSFLGIYLNYDSKCLTLRLFYGLVLVIVGLSNGTLKNSIGIPWVKPLSDSRAFGWLDFLKQN